GAPVSVVGWAPRLIPRRHSGAGRNPARTLSIKRSLPGWIPACAGVTPWWGQRGALELRGPTRGLRLTTTTAVIPAQAGIQLGHSPALTSGMGPACAGVTPWVGSGPPLDFG